LAMSAAGIAQIAEIVGRSQPSVIA
jgi:hypothetical protein